MKRIILNSLRIGRENAITSRQLQDICGCKERVLRDTIRQLRLEGNAILSTTSGTGGYYLPSSALEAERYLRQEEHRARSIFAGLKSARLEAAKAENQLKFDNERAE